RPQPRKVEEASVAGSRGTLAAMLSVRPLPVAALLIATSLSAEERVHRLTSPRQAGETLVRVFTPDALERGRRYPTLSVLPAEANTESRWGDRLAEIRPLDLA